MYKYSIDYYDEEMNLTTDTGFVIGINYSDATRYVVEYYGEDNVIAVYLEGFGEDNHVFPDDQFHD